MRYKYNRSDRIMPTITKEWHLGNPKTSNPLRETNDREIFEHSDFTGGYFMKGKTFNVEQDDIFRSYLHMGKTYLATHSKNNPQGK